jgi:hypothetical protein
MVFVNDDEASRSGIGVATYLFDDNIDFVAIFHVEVFGSFSFVETLAVEEEANIIGVELGKADSTL